MNAPILLFSLCLLLAFSVPSWGGSKNTGIPQPIPQTPQQVKKPIIPSAPIQAGDYIRDPRKPMEMRQYLKELKIKQKEAGANQAAAREKAAAPGKPAPQPTKGGTK